MSARLLILDADLDEDEIDDDIDVLSSCLLLDFFFFLLLLADLVFRPAIGFLGTLFLLKVKVVSR